MTYEETQDAAILAAAKGADSRTRNVVTEYLRTTADLREASAARTELEEKAEYWRDREARAKVAVEQARTVLLAHITAAASE